MPVAYTTHNRILTVTLSGEIDHHRVKGVLQDLDQAIEDWDEQVRDAIVKQTQNDSIKVMVLPNG